MKWNENENENKNENFFYEIKNLALVSAINPRVKEIDDPLKKSQIEGVKRIKRGVLINIETFQIPEAVLDESRIFTTLSQKALNTFSIKRLPTSDII